MKITFIGTSAKEKSFKRVFFNNHFWLNYQLKRSQEKTHFSVYFLSKDLTLAIHNFHQWWIHAIKGGHRQCGHLSDFIPIFSCSSETFNQFLWPANMWEKCNVNGRFCSNWSLRAAALWTPSKTLQNSNSLACDKRTDHIFAFEWKNLKRTFSSGLFCVSFPPVPSRMRSRITSLIHRMQESLIVRFLFSKIFPWNPVSVDVHKFLWLTAVVFLAVCWGVFKVK